jgi:hypothetical protein
MLACSTRSNTTLGWMRRPGGQGGVGVPEIVQSTPDVLGAILVANSPALDRQVTTKAVFPPHRTVSMHTRYPAPDVGQSPRKPLCSFRAPGVRIPPLRFICRAFLRRGSAAEVELLASFGRVRWQFGGRFKAFTGVQWTQTHRMLCPSVPHRDRANAARERARLAQCRRHTGRSIRDRPVLTAARGG